MTTKKRMTDMDTYKPMFRDAFEFLERHFDPPFDGDAVVADMNILCLAKPGNVFLRDMLTAALMELTRIHYPVDNGFTDLTDAEKLELERLFPSNPQQLRF